MSEGHDVVALDEAAAQLPVNAFEAEPADRAAHGPLCLRFLDFHKSGISLAAVVPDQTPPSFLALVVLVAVFATAAARARRDLEESIQRLRRVHGELANAAHRLTIDLAVAQKNRSLFRTAAEPESPCYRGGDPPVELHHFCVLRLALHMPGRRPQWAASQIRLGLLLPQNARRPDAAEEIESPADVRDDVDGVAGRDAFESAAGDVRQETALGPLFLAPRLVLPVLSEVAQWPAPHSLVQRNRESKRRGFFFTLQRTGGRQSRPEAR
ncbi:hypothetical protein LLG88_13055 [bacterium]|nr:hypothetical protein [bacterium]